MEAEGRGAHSNFTVTDPVELWGETEGVAEVVEPLFDTRTARKFTIKDLDGNELGFVRSA